MKKKKRIKWLILLLVIAAIASFGLMASKTTQTAAYTQVTAEKGDLTTYYNFDGLVHAAREQAMASAASGTVRTVYVSQNQQIEKGDRIYRLEGGEIVKADIGGEGMVQMIYTAAPESILYDLALIDNALNNTAYADHSASEIVDAPLYIIDSTEDIQNVVDNTILGTGNFENCGITEEQFKQVLVRFNPEASYADLMAMMGSDDVTVERFSAGE